MAYFPNGSAGAVFEEQCGRCRYGEGHCPVWEVQYLYNYDAVDNPIATTILDTLIKNDGTCMMFKMDPAHFEKHRVPPTTAEAAYYALTAETPKPIRELVLEAAGREA